VKKLLVATAVLGAALPLLVTFTIPPRRLTLTTPFADGTVPGIVHVHSNRSDGQGSPDQIAAAAARAGLRFVVFTDHGDATRTPEPPAYKSGVLCIDAVEISTSGGHYIALDMPAAPYPLAGEPRDVVEDVRRLGGFGIIAHPDSPKPELRWTAWSLPFDGVETTNLDTSWRRWAQQATAADAADARSASWYARRRLATALLDYPFRPVETITSLLRPGGARSLLESLTAQRRVVAIAGADAHAKLAPRGDPADSRVSIPIPGYEQTFKSLSVHVALEHPFTVNAPRDAAMLMRAIRAGHLYTAIDGIATPPAFEFTASNDLGTVREGDQLGVGGPVTLHVRSNAPSPFTTIVFNGGRVFSTDHHEQELTVRAPPDPAAYRVEIWSTGRPNATPWVSSNPIYVRGAEPAAMPIITPLPDAAGSQPLFDGASTTGWRLEHDPNSQIAVDPAGMPGAPELRLRYALAGGVAAGQYVALVHDASDGVAPNGRLSFTVRAERPMRISVQLRVPGGSGEAGERWQRSVYVDSFNQDRIVSFHEMTPVGFTHTAAPRWSDVRSVLFVIDTVNTRPGASGRVWIRRASIER
jgi:predicted metal-dependent phosphoesterase TrpH